MSATGGYLRRRPAILPGPLGGIFCERNAFLRVKD